MRIYFLILATALGLSACDTASFSFIDSNDGKKRNAEFINDTPDPILRLHAQNVETGIWSENLLLDRRLAAHSRVLIDIDDGSGACIYNFKAKVNGNFVRSSNINVCTLAWWRIFRE